ncbi:uncharacterized protein LACBIDRAFT_308083 [Laccaria bicolor S238N-H82]|uniref:Predicted protein n=1 Tax=Laccaria bicolor (strain S238N-H82 / ATCC MYA-4686) TaxID=486041 RepID=B0DRL5_LACBS|nr:uncharacterized protein LACBIDRAFT_308083 [Laccaria bicolor S238N-H82]EDR02805.1 predicted protein [Laccaria bicolor S238N-H82]|eukprot:XP_001886515.1 predicted protein [Laccaria bicolor S238N-H82]
MPMFLIGRAATKLCPRLTCRRLRLSLKGLLCFQLSSPPPHLYVRNVETIFGRS